MFSGKAFGLFIMFLQFIYSILLMKYNIYATMISLLHSNVSPEILSDIIIKENTTKRSTLEGYADDISHIIKPTRNTILLIESIYPIGFFLMIQESFKGMAKRLEKKIRS